MIAANDYVDPMLPRMSAVQLRALMAQAAGLLAYAEGGEATINVVANMLRALRQAYPLGEPPPPTPRKSRMADIAFDIAHRHGVTVADLKGPRRLRRFAYPRQEAYYECVKAGHSRAATGRFFGGRDHTTVLWGIAQHARRLAEGGAQ